MREVAILAVLAHDDGGYVSTSKELQKRALKDVSAICISPVRSAETLNLKKLIFSAKSEST
jgi:hypothetical protein